MDNVNPLSIPGQQEPDSRHPLNLSYLAELLMATEEDWATLPDPYPLFGNEFLEGLLEEAGDGS